MTKTHREKIGGILTKFQILRDRSWLVYQYHTLGHTQQEIADQVGCTQLRVQWWVKRHKIPIPDWAHREARSERISKKLKGNKNGLGRVVSQELKDRFSRERKGRNNPFYGRKRNQEWYDKMVPIWKDRKGPKNPNWKDGASRDPYPIEFGRQLKELIRQRDDYQCQKCGCSEVENIKKLSAHHIDYNKENCLPSNLVSLCCSCNSAVNKNRTYWEACFKEKISVLHR